MGLDMFLFARRSFFSLDKNSEESRIAAMIKAALPETADMELSSVKFEAIYWRKANAIHAWFVKHVQMDNDDCGEYFVRRSDLENLMNDCDLVLVDHSRAEEILPSVSGFFFGSTDYDEYYFKDIQFTRDKIKNILDNTGLMEKYDFYYSSSW